MKRFWLGALLGLLLTSAVGAQGVAGLTIVGDEVQAHIDVGGYEADVTIRFESVSGLTAANLGLWAEVVDPTAPAILARLPSGASIPAEFPVLVHIDPPSTSSLSFSGVVSVEIYTLALSYSGDPTLRVFTAAGPGQFENATTAASDGSIRTSDMQPDFPRSSAMARDPLPVATVATYQLAALQTAFALNLPSINPLVAAALGAKLTTVESAVANSDWAGAIIGLDQFSALVVANSGPNIPNVWSAGESFVNAAGLLRTDASRLRFNLQLASF